MREIVDLAFVLLAVEANGSELRYAMQLNRHLNGYNFFGGHVEEGERAADAALRELREELSDAETQGRWGVAMGSDVPAEEWVRLRARMEAVSSGDGDVIQVPFYSLRSTRDGMPEERKARIKLFELVFNVEEFPGIADKLDFLVDSSVPCPWDERSRPLCRYFSAPDLKGEGWASPFNPFVRVALKNGAIRGISSNAPGLPFVVDPLRMESAMQGRLSMLLRHVLDLDHGESIDVQLIPPADAQIDSALRGERSLYGRLEVRWSGSERVWKVDFPHPYHGVFLLGSDDRERRSWVWHPRMMPRPGLWRIRKYGPKDDHPLYLRLVLSGGTGIWDIEEPQDDKAKKKALGNMLDRIKWDRPSLLPDLVEGRDDASEERRSRGDGQPFLFVSSKREMETLLGAVVERNAHDVTCAVYDEQSLDYQRLITYEVYLTESIVSRVLGRLLGVRGRAAPLVRPGQLRGEEGRPGADKVWEGLCGSGDTPGSLVDVDALRRKGWLHYFAPVNAIHAISDLTAFQRYDFKSEQLERLPAHWRQNHPSFQGLVCPVETPETKKVGLTLHLASGVLVDSAGRLHRPADPTGLGYGASLVPFFGFNDAPRAMMGAKNIKQALPVRGAEVPLILSGGEGPIRQLTRSLVERGIVPGECGSGESVLTGVNLLVAYMPWYGWNFEDAIVANNRVVEEGVLDWQYERVFSVYVRPGYEPVPMPEHLSSPLRVELMKALFGGESMRPEALFRPPGPVNPADPVAFLENTTSGSVSPVRCGGEGPGELIAVRYHRPAHRYLGGKLEWTVRYKVPVELGDKLMGRYGNKGVIGKILPPAELPRLPDDPRLPEPLRGRVVDLVLNPHGVISRMNLGQLMETHAGLVRAIDPDSISEDVGRPFNELDLPGALRESIRRINNRPQGDGRAPKDPVIDDDGRIHLIMPDGDPTPAPVVTGFQYIFRLKHIPSWKTNARSGREREAGYDVVTGQPVAGRRRRGGQRLGEMEIWALAAHGAGINLEEVLGPKSDPSNGEETQIFRAVREHLFTLGMKLDNPGNGYQIEDVPREELEELPSIESPDDWQMAVKGRFACPRSGCGYHYPVRAIRSTGLTQNGIRYLSLADVLRHAGLRLQTRMLAGRLPQPETRRHPLEKVLALPLEALSGGSQTEQLEVRLLRGRGDVKAVIKLDKMELHAYAQIKSNDYALSNLPGLGIACPRHATTWLRCDHPFSEAVAVPGGLCDPLKVGGTGIEDIDTRFSTIILPFPVVPRLLKSRDSGLGSVSRIVVLPLKYRADVPTIRDGMLLSRSHPLTDAYKSLLVVVEIARRAFDVELLRHAAESFLLAVKDCARSETSKRWRELLAERVRLLSEVRTSLQKCEDSYKKPLQNLGRNRDDFLDVIDDMRSECKGQVGEKKIEASVRELRRILRSTDRLDEILKEIEDGVGEIYRLVWKGLAGKDGLMRRCGLGRRVNRSARLVVVPDPTLAWEQCGVPVAVLMHLLSDRIAQWEGLGRLKDVLLLRMLKAYFQEEGVDHEKVERIINEPGLIEELRRPDFWKDFDWAQHGSRRELMEISREVLEGFLSEHDHIRVLLNRAPTLHKYNIMAFRPVPQGPDEGLVLKINPLVCKGFAADFDGDEMAIHVPDDDTAHHEAALLEPTEPSNLLSVADGKPMAHFDQDFVLGHFLMVQAKDRLQQEAGSEGYSKLAGLFPECPDCQACLLCPQDGQALLRHLCTEHPEEAAQIVPAWMRLAFAAVTEAAVSFGYLELLDDRPDIDERPSGSAEGMDNPMELSPLSEKIGERALSHLREIVETSAPGDSRWAFSAMATSGARGRKQARQLVAARGWLTPGDVGFDPAWRQFFLPVALVDGMSPAQAFWSAMNGRSSMVDKKLGTPQAGRLTRALVLACWPWYVVEKDCGARRITGIRHSIVDCLLVAQGKGVCARCYGEVPGLGRLAPTGYPAGLIAAQSFGERGTQLSMQSFHTGSKGVSIADIDAIFRGKDHECPMARDEEPYNWFVADDDAMRFADRIHQIPAYAGIDERHLLLIWYAIHKSGRRSLFEMPASALSVFAAMAGSYQWMALRKLVSGDVKLSGTVSPLQKVFLGQAPLYEVAAETS